jgi:hypothetical protein
MKPLKSIFLVVLMVASIIAPSVGTSLTAFAQDPISTIGAEIVVVNMPNEGEIGTSLQIPKGQSSDGSVTTTITNPKNAVVFDSSEDILPDGPNNTYVFNPEFTGNYTVQYSVVSTDEAILASTYSKEYNIMVSGDRPVLEFDNNSNVFLPQVTNFDYLITVPYPEVYSSEGEQLSLADVANNINITVNDPQGDSVDIITESYINNGVTYYAFTPQVENGEGIYSIDYYYIDNSNLSAREELQFEVSQGFDPEDINLGYSLNGSMPESAILGEEVNLPKPVTRDRNSGNELLNTYTEVSVEYINADGQNIVYNVEDFTFTPANDGDYQVTYEVYDFFGEYNDQPTADYVYTISNVEDTKAPTVMPVENYLQQDVDDSEAQFTEAEYNIPSNVAVGDTVNFPAIYGVDNLSLSSDLNYQRAIINANNTIIDLDHEAGDLYNYNETVPYTFLQEGTYTVRYRATDEEGNQKTATYSLSVVDGFVDNQEPRITMPTNIPFYAETGDEISFSKPTAIDYESQTSTQVIDKRVELSTYFYVGNDITTAVEIYEDEDNSENLSFTIPYTLPEDFITIYVEATDDSNNTATSSKVINLLDTTDTLAPTLAGSQPTILPVDQNTVVDIPTVKFTDDNPQFITVNVDVRDPNNNKVNVTGVSYEYEADTGLTNDDNGILVSDGSFTAILAGNYRITYTATDIANNSYIISYAQYVNNTQPPSFNIGAIESNVEAGQTITLPVPTILDNGEEIDNQALTPVVFIDSPSYNFNIATYEFTPLEEGIYNFKYIAEDNFGNTSESAVYTITSTDTLDPVITINPDVAFPVTAPLTRPTENDPYNSITIPDFIAYDEHNGIREFSVEVKNPNGSVILGSENGEQSEGSSYSFTPTRNGSYTVTYSATDFAGNTTEEVRIVKVGDTSAPTITVNNPEINRPDNMSVNNTLTLDIDSIIIEDNEDGTIDPTQEATTGESKFSVKLTAPNGTTVERIDEDSYSYNLNQSGDYTITYTARDDAGNERVETVVFQVVAEEMDPTIVTQTLGIILIIGALLVLAGVVIYFVRSREIIED